MKHILLVDDHLMFASALQYLLKAFDSTIDAVPVVSIAAAFDVLEQGRSFDLILVDYAMPAMNGIDGIRALRARYPNCIAAILSGNVDAGLVREALAAGAIGWLPKTMSGEPLIHALHLMMLGEAFVPSALMQDIATPAFSSRETDVAELLAEGLADKEIADRLSLQLGTVKVHVKKLLKKAGAENRTRFALLYRSRS